MLLPCPFVSLLITSSTSVGCGEWDDPTASSFSVADRLRGSYRRAATTMFRDKISWRRTYPHCTEGPLVVGVHYIFAWYLELALGEELGFIQADMISEPVHLHVLHVLYLLHGLGCMCSISMAFFFTLMFAKGFFILNGWKDNFFV